MSGRDAPPTSPAHLHLVSVIASYIHHHGDPHVPIGKLCCLDVCMLGFWYIEPILRTYVGATKLLTRLSLVSPVSVFGCLGDKATPIRDVFVRRLCSRVEVRFHDNTTPPLTESPPTGS